MAHPVRLNQLVYGYQDGHRLLSASDDLPDGVARALLVHSDREAGARLSPDVGSWTGVPLDEHRLYAVLCTWAAPEMPRPGCVWTQALLIRFADMARFQTFTGLRALFRRPASQDLARYAKALVFDPDDRFPEPVIAMPHAAELVAALYEPQASGQIRPSDAAVDLCFAAWAQQWPRLRRTFSFRTGAVDRHAAAAAPSFTLRVVDGAWSTERGPDIWAAPLCVDLVAAEPTDLRRFLWRYGPDLPQGRAAIPFLAALFATTRQTCFERGELQRVLTRVNGYLPAAADGRVLKTDLMALGRSEYTLLPPGDPIDLLSFYAEHPDAGQIVDIDLNDLARDIATVDLLPILQTAIDNEAPIADALPELICAVARSSDGGINLLRESMSFPAAQERLLTTDPSLIDSDAVTDLSWDLLIVALSRIPADADLVRNVTARLIDRHEPEIVRALADANIAAVVDVLFERLSTHFARHTAPPDGPWIDAVHARIENASPVRLLAQSHSFSQIAACAELIYWDISAGLRSSALPWAEALQKAEDDLDGDTTRRLFCFLLAVAIARPVPGSEAIFECTFEPVHNYLWSNWGSPGHFWQLERILPNLNWWQQWDNCRRLRLGVSASYINGQLEPASFLRLTSDQYLQSEMIRTAEETKSGRHYIKKVMSAASSG